MICIMTLGKEGKLDIEELFVFIDNLIYV